MKNMQSNTYQHRSKSMLFHPAPAKEPSKYITKWCRTDVHSSWPSRSVLCNWGFFFRSIHIDPQEFPKAYWFFDIVISQTVSPNMYE